MEDWSLSIQEPGRNNWNLLEAQTMPESERSNQEPREPVLQEIENTKKREPKFANINEICAEQPAVDTVLSAPDDLGSPPETTILPAVEVPPLQKRPRADEESLDVARLLDKCRPEKPCVKPKRIQNVLTDFRQAGQPIEPPRSSAPDFWETIDLLTSSDEDGDFLSLRRKVRAPKMSWPVDRSSPTRTAEQLRIFLAPYESWCRNPEVRMSCPTFTDPAQLMSSTQFQKPSFEWPKFLYEQVFMPSRKFTGEHAAIRQW